jgi:hypothetical protein
MTWGGSEGEQVCCRTCKSSGGKAHGANCDANNAAFIRSGSPTSPASFPEDEEVVISSGDEECVVISSDDEGGYEDEIVNEVKAEAEDQGSEKSEEMEFQKNPELFFGKFAAEKTHLDAAIKAVEAIEFGAAAAAAGSASLPEQHRMDLDDFAAETKSPARRDDGNMAKVSVCIVFTFLQVR